MAQVKDSSVNLDGLVPEVRARLSGMEACRTAALILVGTQEMVITSAKDGKHKDGSKHYEGKAVDLRIRDFYDAWITYLKQSLGKDWDVVLEDDHIHVEYAPK